MRLFKWIGSVLVSVFLMVTAVTAKEEGYCVEGKVLDEKGHPVQGASFTLYQYGAVMKDHQCQRRMENYRIAGRRLCAESRKQPLWL